MAKEEAGIATEAAMVIRMANGDFFSQRRKYRGKKRRTYLAPDGCPIPRIAVPDNRVDEEVQRRQRRPEHKEYRSRVPCLKMPRQRNEREGKSKEAEDREERVGWISHYRH
jgi:hypothetical protein